MKKLFVNTSGTKKRRVNGIPEARNFPVFRFFLNDFSTTTQGLDLISSLAVGRTTVSAVFNYTDTAVKNIESAVIDEFRINTLERGLPNTRWNVSTILCIVKTAPPTKSRTYAPFEFRAEDGETPPLCSTLLSSSSHLASVSFGRCVGAAPTRCWRTSLCGSR